MNFENNYGKVEPGEDFTVIGLASSNARIQVTDRLEGQPLIQIMQGTPGGTHVDDVRSLR